METVKKDLEQLLRADEIVEAINKALPEAMHLKPLTKGFAVKELDRTAAGAALQAVVESLGGIPAMIAWAASDPKHMGQLYEMYFKQIPKETKVEHSGGLTLLTELPDSPFDEYEGDRNAPVQH